jgi:2-polyprenyl-6-methoxyphenol hydroxylase-like FAD-dependent oxidoreductase
MDQWDVVIVGARCAGSSLAAHLAGAGLRVCVLDRSRFPSDTPSTHGIQPCGVQALDRLGVLDRVSETTMPIENAVVALGAARIYIEDSRSILGAPMLNVRRSTLDQILVENAVDAGAELRTQTNVSGLLHDNDRVCGVRTTTGDITARLVIGADGYRSTVARLVAAPEYAVTPAGRIFAWAYLDGVPRPAAGPATVWLGKPRSHGFLASPTDAGMFMAAITVDPDLKGSLLADREAFYRAAFHEWPELNAIIESGRVVGPVRIMSPRPGYFRRSAGPGWALVGDAGHFKDPTTGQGISDALRQTEQLAAAITQGLSGNQPLDQLIERWWRWRDKDAWPMYWFAHDLGAVGPTPAIVGEVQRRIAADPRLTQRLIRVLNHELPPSSLTPVSVLSRALLTTLRHNTGRRRVVLHEARGLVRDELARQRRRFGAPALNVG